MGDLQKYNVKLFARINRQLRKLINSRNRKRLNRDNLFVMWTFTGGTDEVLLSRFDALPFENKVAFTERVFPTYKSAYCIPGFEEEGLAY